MVSQNYTHRTKPTEYRLQQKKEIRSKSFLCRNSRRKRPVRRENGKPSKHPTEPHKGKIRRFKRRVRPFFLFCCETKVLHKSAVVFEELRLIPQKNAAVRK